MFFILLFELERLAPPMSTALDGFDYSVVFGVRADPEPDDLVGRANA
jgi:hypothetical protein